MPEDARIKVYEYAHQLFTSPKPAKQYTPVSAKQVYSDLETSREEIEEGKGVDMREALMDMGRQHGFI